MISLEVKLTDLTDRWSAKYGLFVWLVPDLHGLIPFVLFIGPPSVDIRPRVFVVVFAMAYVLMQDVHPNK